MSSAAALRLPRARGHADAGPRAAPPLLDGPRRGRLGRGRRSPSATCCPGPSPPRRNRSNVEPIAMINLFLGWSLVGWVVALVMACGSDQPVVVVQHALRRRPHASSGPSPSPGSLGRSRQPQPRPAQPWPRTPPPPALPAPPAYTSYPPSRRWSTPWQPSRRSSCPARPGSRTIGADVLAPAGPDAAAAARPGPAARRDLGRTRGRGRVAAGGPRVRERRSAGTVMLRLDPDALGRAGGRPPGRDGVGDERQDDHHALPGRGRARGARRRTPTGSSTTPTAPTCTAASPRRSASTRRPTSRSSRPTSGSSPTWSGSAGPRSSCC